MPNTPALVQCGASIFSCGSNTCSEDEILVKQLFSSIGFCAHLPEKHLDAVTGLSGSGPAYVSHLLLLSITTIGCQSISQSKLIYIVPLQDPYSETFQAQSKKTVLRR